MAMINALRRAESKYADVKGVTVSLAHKVSKWDDSHVDALRVYQVTQLDETNTVRYGRYLRQCLDTGTGLDSRLLSLILMMAVSMRDPDDNKKLLMKTVSTSANKNARILEVPSVEDADDEEDEVSNALIEKFNGKKQTTMLEKLIDESVGGKSEAGTSDMTGELLDQASAYSFLSAYLLRLQCRTVDNVAKNLATAVTRYKGWYEKGIDILETLQIEKAKLEKLREVIARRPEIISTWVLWLAKSENSMDIGRQQKGLLDYLGIQVFSYQGMHAVTQTIALQQTCKVPMDALLRDLDGPLTRAAVKEVYNIIKNYEKTDANPNRLTYFRYARVWDSGYFLNVQSKNCAPLVYLVAKTLKSTSSNTLSDPTQIFAIQNMGTDMKERIDDVSGKLSRKLLLISTVDEESGDIWDVDPEETKAQ